MFRIAAPAAHHIFPLMAPLPPLAEQLLGAEINKIPHTLVCGILCDRYTIDECTSSLSHISNFFILDSACFLFFAFDFNSISHDSSIGIMNTVDINSKKFKHGESLFK